jgi:hypothetical protein
MGERLRSERPRRGASNQGPNRADVPVIATKDEEDEFDAGVGNEEYKTIHQQALLE